MRKNRWSMFMGKSRMGVWGQTDPWAKFGSAPIFIKRFIGTHLSPFIYTLELHSHYRGRGVTASGTLQSAKSILLIYCPLQKVG